MIRHGPALDIGNAEILGPIRLVEDNEMKEQRLRTPVHGPSARSQ